MSICRFCKGSGSCKPCEGTGDGKSVTPHPSRSHTNPNTGAVRCPICGGGGVCQGCNGTGKE